MTDGFQKSPFKIAWGLVPDGATSILHLEMALDLDGIGSDAEARRIVANILTKPIFEEDQATLEQWMADAALQIQLGLTDSVSGE